MMVPFNGQKFLSCMSYSLLIAALSHYAICILYRISLNSKLCRTFSSIRISVFSLILSFLVHLELNFVFGNNLHCSICSYLGFPVPLIEDDLFFQCVFLASLSKVHSYVNLCLGIQFGYIIEYICLYLY